MVKNAVLNLDLSKVPGPDCIQVLVQKNCEPELSYVLAELFNKCLKESLFPGRSHQWSLYLRILGKRSTTKNYCRGSLLSVVGKVFEKLTQGFPNSIKAWGKLRGWGMGGGDQKF